MDTGTILTVAEIAELAFKKFIESGAGELAKKFTEAAIVKMDELRRKIWEKMQGKPTAEAALTSIEAGSGEEFDLLVAYLQVAMDDDPHFADEIQLMAREIHAGKIQDNSSMIQNNSGHAKSWQTKVEGGTNYIGEVRIYQGKVIDSEKE